VGAASGIFFYGRIADRVVHGGQRLVIWRTIHDGVTATPMKIVLGGGARCSLSLFPAGYGFLWHIDFLEVFATGGVVLLALYVAFLLWMLVPFVPLASSHNQTSRTRGFGVVCLFAFCAYLVMSFFDGVVFIVAGLPMAALVGLARGMKSTPEATFIDQGLHFFRAPRIPSANRQGAVSPT